MLKEYKVAIKVRTRSKLLVGGEAVLRVVVMKTATRSIR
jgi:hypothetical protein